MNCWISVGGGVGTAICELVRLVGAVALHVEVNGSAFTELQGDDVGFSARQVEFVRRTGPPRGAGAGAKGFTGFELVSLLLMNQPKERNSEGRCSLKVGLNENGLSLCPDRLIPQVA